ncbi:flavodoxin [Butyricicoccus sp. 1XD8-22]|nr:flavodoxin [Butyricicoccus sp. 1XD8-22]
MKTAVIYYSHHHGNTKKVLDAIAAQYPDVTLIDAATVPATELSDYDLIGFASGIYFSQFHNTVLKLAQEQLPEGKNVFLLYTCGVNQARYTKAIHDIMDLKGAHMLGVYSCRGYDTFGPWKLLGGIAKGHPSQKDLNGALEFFQHLWERLEVNP